MRTSVAAVQPPVVRRTGGFLKKRITTTYVDSRREWSARTATSRSTWESRCTCRATPRSPSTRSAWPTVSCPRTGELGAYTGARLAAWISSNFATATYSETTNSLSVAYDGNRLILKRPGAAPAASSTKPFSVDHMLGPSFVSGGQQVFEFVRMMARNKVYLQVRRARDLFRNGFETSICLWQDQPGFANPCNLGPRFGTREPMAMAWALVSGAVSEV